MWLAVAQMVAAGLVRVLLDVLVVDGLTVAPGYMRKAFPGSCFSLRSMACLVAVCLAPFCPDLLLSIVAVLAAAPGCEGPVSPQTQRVSPCHLLFAEKAILTQLRMFSPRLPQRTEAMALAVVLVALLSRSQ